MVDAKGQLISKCLLEKIVWTKIATKKFDNFCPGGQIKKIKTLYYIKYPIIDIRKCLYFFDLTTRAEIVKFFRCYFGPNDFFQKAFWNQLIFSREWIDCNNAKEHLLRYYCPFIHTMTERKRKKNKKIALGIPISIYNMH